VSANSCWMLKPRRSDGVGCVAFGDLFLDDIRKYREEKLSAIDLEAAFPLWGLDTTDLVRDMVNSGLKARVTCVDPQQLNPCLIGRELDLEFLNNLPSNVDPCGENGEYHSFAYDGPMFVNQIPIVLGEIVHKNGFVFADFL
jgi:diphthamide synthase (EF-2-diphthine--ammonia ligase)